MTAPDCTAYLVYITTKNEDEAREISKVLLNERLVACTNLIKGMESAYHWQGHIETAVECILIAKTIEHRLDELKKRVVELHSYDCPCVIAWPVPKGHGPYLSWLKEEVR